MQLDTIAKPYANALFAIANEDKSHPDWARILTAAATLVADERLQTFIASPKATKADKTQTLTILLKSILDRVLTHQETAFIDLLVTNGRLEVLPSIARHFDLMRNLSVDTKTFQVFSAHRLSTTEEERIISDLTNKYQTKVNIEPFVDKNLLGGVMIKEGDKVIDLSIQARVSALGLCLSATD